jgi:hypothetical protein
MRQDHHGGSLIAQALTVDNRPSSGQRNTRGWYSAFNPWTWALTINSVTVSPTFVYLASEINPGDGGWGEHFGAAGGALVLQAGAVPTYNQNSLFGPKGDDRAIKYNGGGYHQAVGNAFADITTEDLVIEAIYRPVTATKVVAAKRAAGAGVGWILYHDGSDQISTVLVSAAAARTIASVAVPANNWCHVLFFCDRSGFGQCYLNGTASGAAVDISAAAGTLTVAAPCCIGAYDNGTVPFDGRLANLAMWKSAGWLDTHLQAAVAQELFQRRMGLLPQLAPSGDELLTLTRTTPKHFARRHSAGIDTLHFGGAGMFCLEETQGEAGLGVWQASQNICLQSQTLDVDGAGSPWTHTRATVPANSTTAPDGTTTADTLHEDATAANTHSITQSVALTSAAWVFSIWAKKVNRDWLRFFIFDGSTSFTRYFDLNNGVVGSGSNDDAQGIEDWGNGWYRCWMAITATGAGSVNLHIAEADGDVTFDGLDQDSLYLWGAQCELGNYPSPYIPTVASAVTRNADNVDVHADIAAALSTAGEMTIACEVKTPNRNVASFNDYIFQLHDGTSNNRIDCFVAFADQKIELYMADGGVQQAWFDVGADITDGAWHDLSVAIREDGVSVIIDGTEGTDTDCTVPAISAFSVGRYGVTNTSYLDGWIRNVRVFNRALH